MANNCVKFSIIFVVSILLSAGLYISPSLVLNINPHKTYAQSDAIEDSFEVNLSNNTGTSSYPQLAVSGINVYVVWEDTSSASGSFDIFFKRSTDNGQTFGDIINLSNNTGNSINPQLAVYGSNISVVWEDEITNNPFNNTDNNNDNSGILYVASTDNGQTFGEIINLSNSNNSTAANRTAVNPQLAVSGSNISVAWEEYPQGQNGDVIFKRSTDNGQTFGDIINLSNNTGNSINPQLAVSGNNIYAVWSDNSAGDYDIFLSRSTDGGGNFSKRTNLSIVVGNSLTPTIAVSGDNVFVAWRDFIIGSQARAEILYTKSNDNGNTFDKIINLSNSTGPSLYPQLIAFGNNVYLIWEDATPGNSEIFFVRSADNGDTFDRKINLSNSRGNSVFAHMAVYGDNVYVVWSDDDKNDYERQGERQVFNATTMHNVPNQEENSDIFFSKSNNEGATFSDVKKLSDGRGESVFPSIVASRSNVFIVWSKYDISGNTTAPGNSEIVFTRRI